MIVGPTNETELDEVLCLDLGQVETEVLVPGDDRLDLGRNRIEWT